MSEIDLEYARTVSYTHLDVYKRQILLNGAPVWENKEALKHIYFAREINGAASSSISGFKVKEYLKIASEYLPDWDEELAEKLIKLFHLDKKKRIVKLSKGMTSMPVSYTHLVESLL